MNGPGFGVSFDPVSTWHGPRAPLEEEWPALRAAINQVFRPQGGDLTRECPLLFGPENRANLSVIVDTAVALNQGGEGGDRDAAARIVGHAGVVIRDAAVLGRRIRVACVGAVMTAPAERNKGVASQVVTDLLDRIRPGVDLVLASGDRGLYRRQYLEPLPPLARFSLPPAPPAPPLDVRAVTADDLPALASLYEAEPVHFVRSPSDWRRLWEAGRLVDAPAAFSAVSRGGRVVGYLVAQAATPRADGSVRPRRIMEIAGERDAVLSVAPSLADELLLPSYDSASIALGERQGWIRSSRQFLITALSLTPELMVIPWYGLNYL